MNSVETTTSSFSEEEEDIQFEIKSLEVKGKGKIILKNNEILSLTSSITKIEKQQGNLKIYVGEEEEMNKSSSSSSSLSSVRTSNGVISIIGFKNNGLFIDGISYKMITLKSGKNNGVKILVNDKFIHDEEDEPQKYSPKKRIICSGGFKIQSISLSNSIECDINEKCYLSKEEIQCSLFGLSSLRILPVLFQEKGVNTLNINLNEYSFFHTNISSENLNINCSGSSKIQLYGGNHTTVNINCSDSSNIVGGTFIKGKIDASGVSSVIAICKNSQLIHQTTSDLSSISI